MRFCITDEMFFFIICYDFNVLNVFAMFSRRKGTVFGKFSVEPDFLGPVDALKCGPGNTETNRYKI